MRSLPNVLVVALPVPDNACDSVALHAAQAKLPPKSPLLAASTHVQQRLYVALTKVFRPLLNFTL